MLKFAPSGAMGILEKVVASNSFGQIFRITTWGESHGPAIGVVIDGCPAGLMVSVEEINEALSLRAPGRNAHVSPRKEPDECEILSGVFEGETTGAPISMIIKNHNADSAKYEAVKHLVKPGHANKTYLEKYGVFDYRGSGRSSARETACRVAAGVVAKKMLNAVGIDCVAYLQSVGAVVCDRKHYDKMQIIQSPIFCPDTMAEKRMLEQIDAIKQQGDSIGGIVAFSVTGLPIGLGDPVYEKLEANLAKAMLSINASKGFEIGEGFAACQMHGSDHNQTHYSGGTLGGISDGEALYGRVAFKPTSSIKIAQATKDLNGHPATFQLPEGSKHDPCVAIRAVPVVEAMLALVLVDSVLMQRLATL